MAPPRKTKNSNRSAPYPPQASTPTTTVDITQSNNSSPPSISGNMRSETFEQSYMPLKLAADMIPIFDGKSVSIEYFIKQCKQAESFVKPGDKPLLQALITSKIKGNANDLTEGSYSGLTELLKTLRACYSKLHDIEDVEDLIRDLRQEPNEKIADYSARVKKTLNMGVDMAIENPSSVDLNSIIESLRTKAKKGFIRGIRNETIKNRVILDKESDTLETAIQIAMKAEKDLLEHAKLFALGPKDVGDKTNNNADKFIKQVNKINSTPRTCFTCGDPNHISKNCPKNNRSKNYKRINENDSTKIMNENKNKSYNSKQCTYCKKMGHLEEQCLFKAKKEGKPVCYLHKAIGHTCVDLYQKNSQNVPQISAVRNISQNLLQNQRTKSSP